jgi:hypothetical protein
MTAYERIESFFLGKTEMSLSNKMYRDIGAVDPVILNYRSRWRWLVSLKDQPLCLRDKVLVFAEKEDGRSQNMSGDFEHRKNLLLLPGVKLRFQGYPARNLTQYWINYPRS